jgi:hypothetical protein
MLRIWDRHHSAAQAGTNPPDRLPNRSDGVGEHAAGIRSLRMLECSVTLIESGDSAIKNTNRPTYSELTYLRKRMLGWKSSLKQLL